MELKWFEVLNILHPIEYNKPTNDVGVSKTMHHASYARGLMRRSDPLFNYVRFVPFTRLPGASHFNSL